MTQPQSTLGAQSAVISQASFDIMDVISAIAFAMSLTTWIYTWFCQRKNLRIAIVHYLRIPTRHFLYVSLENRSRLPILISQVYLVSGSNKLECRVVSKKVYRTSAKNGGETTHGEFVKNLQLPIQLSSLGGISGYLAFEDDQQTVPTLTTEVNFEVHTNRGGLIEMKLPLHRILDPNQIL